jgi:ankyrin repeat protein
MMEMMAGLVMIQDRGQLTPHNALPSRLSLCVMSLQDGASSLYIASQTGHVEAVKALIASRADVQAKENLVRGDKCRI